MVKFLISCKGEGGVGSELLTPLKKSELSGISSGCKGPFTRNINDCDNFNIGTSSGFYGNKYRADVRTAGNM